MLGRIEARGLGRSYRRAVRQPTTGDVQVYGFHPVTRRQLSAQHVGVVRGRLTRRGRDLRALGSYRAPRHSDGLDAARSRAGVERIVDLRDLADLPAELVGVPVRQLTSHGVADVEQVGDLLIVLGQGRVASDSPQVDQSVVPATPPEPHPDDLTGLWGGC